MGAGSSHTILCLTSSFKGRAFLEECHAQGYRVLLLTREKLRHEAWPRESLDELFYMPSFQQHEEVVKGVSYLARHQKIRRIIALDDLDVELAAALREHLRLPGMGATTARYFRDKLAMRVRAREGGVRVPDFCPVLNYEELGEWMSRVAAPWVLKPRSEASSVGIKKIHHPDELWHTLEALGDRQSFYVLEQYVRGTVYHVDGIVWEGALRFEEVHGYASPPLDVMQRGGLFSTRTLPREAPEVAEIRRLHAQLVRELGLVRGVTHTEFIRGEADGHFYFLEAAARVGGANIAEMVEAATGINLWREWARLEIAHLRGQRYEVPEPASAYAGVLISLARQEFPDLSHYDDPEIVWRMEKRHHAGLIVRATDPERVRALLHGYMRRFAQEFAATLPPLDTLVDQ